VRTPLQSGGRRRKPAALGGKATTKAEREAALAAAESVPPPPEGLSDWELQAWERAKAVIDPLRVYTSADAIAFQQLVTCLAMILEAEAALREHGLTVSSSQGIKQRPEVQVILSAQKNLWLGLSRFGLSPSDRSRVEAVPEETPWQRERRLKMAEFG
jgi:P27 family predicted phage terminase small subunit